MKQRSRTQKEGQRDVEDTVIPRGDVVSAKEEKIGVRATYSHELDSSTAGSTSGPPSNKYYVKAPLAVSPVKTPSAGERASHNHELGIGITNSSGAHAYSYYVSSLPPSLSPVSYPVLETTGSRATQRHELDITTTGSTSDDEEHNRYTVSPPDSPSPVKLSLSRDQITTLGHPSAAKNIKNLPPRIFFGAVVKRVSSLRYSMGRSESVSSSRLAGKKQIPRRYAIG